MCQLVNSSITIQIGLGIIRAFKTAPLSGIVFGMLETVDESGPTPFYQMPNLMLYYKYALLALLHHPSGQDLGWLIRRRGRTELAPSLKWIAW